MDKIYLLYVVLLTAFVYRVKAAAHRTPCPERTCLHEDPCEPTPTLPHTSYKVDIELAHLNHSYRTNHPVIYATFNTKPDPNPNYALDEHKYRRPTDDDNALRLQKGRRIGLMFEIGRRKPLNFCVSDIEPDQAIRLKVQVLEHDLRTQDGTAGYLELDCPLPQFVLRNGVVGLRDECNDMFSWKEFSCSTGVDALHRATLFFSSRISRNDPAICAIR
ncbi:hypothetical protein RvY_16377 [Ramazzottius varieornatus]|uniref:Uncharacterized protein n=1 Tax=Ramazzottius varieornatus TaxID=947166 RepID=A0A1D1W2K8_RAMVA|nr:hypothetical protein RvY_16377 [Ramazzottius varieornatus]